MKTTFYLDTIDLQAQLAGKNRQIEFLLNTIEQLDIDLAEAQRAAEKAKAKGSTATRPRKAKAETPMPALTPDDPTRVPDTMPAPAGEPTPEPHTVGDPQTDGPSEVTSLEGGRRRRFGL